MRQAADLRDKHSPPSTWRPLSMHTPTADKWLNRNSPRHPPFQQSPPKTAGSRPIGSCYSGTMPGLGMSVTLPDPVQCTLTGGDGGRDRLYECTIGMAHAQGQLVVTYNFQFELLVTL